MGAQHPNNFLTALSAKDFELLRPHLKPGTPIALCSKGIERGSLKLMTDVLAEEAPDADGDVVTHRHRRFFE